MNEQERGEQKPEPELKRPDDAIKDLEPEQDESAAVKGGLKIDFKV
jgi:hypothetical protein